MSAPSPVVADATAAAIAEMKLDENAATLVVQNTIVKDESGEDSSEDEEVDEKGLADVGTTSSGDSHATAEKKKKKKKKNKKKKTADPVVNACGVHLFCQGGRNPVPNVLSTINFNKAVKHRQQTSPISVPVSSMYQNKIMPEGQIMPHGGVFNTSRTSNEELRASNHITDDMLNEIREAAEVHRQVRADFMHWVKPGLSMIEIAQYIENNVKAGLGAKNGEGERLKRGWAFPTGCSVNHVAAHYSPNYKDTNVLRQSDVMKIDFGTHINGRIIDSAFTVAFEEKYDPLLNAVKEATNTGLKAAGIDVRLCDIGEQIEEVMQSFEIELNGVTYPIKCIRNLNGHDIKPYKIHGGKSVPITKNQDTTKMEEGEFYAIETFGTTGRGYVVDGDDCSHYMKKWDGEFRPLRTKASKDLLRHIDLNHSTLAFARRWIDDEGCKGHLGALKELVHAGIVDDIPPLLDIKGSYTAQFEHTFFLRPTCKEILSRGDDY